MTQPFEALGPDFSDPVEPADFPKTILRYRNDRAAKTVGLDGLSDAEWLSHFGRFEPLPGNMPRPLAIRYHGHQFRSYNPQIGDGRGFLFAQLRDDQGRLLDLGTKGSGQTPYSRFGDGRLTLKGGVREVLATEMLEASGVPTSKTFSLIETGEQLSRNDEPSPTRSSVMVRLQHSHVRFGAFQRLAYLKEEDNLVTLLNHVRDVYHPDIPPSEPASLAPALLTRIAQRTANMVASWMAAGFVHGVMNTDNMNVTGDTFDFGPYRFLPTSDPKFTAAYFDEYGLYAFGRQPSAAIWNLQQLGGAFAMVASVEDLTEALQAFEPAYQTALCDHCFAQLGLTPSELSADLSFLEKLFSWMTDTQIPWDQFFFDWFGGKDSTDRAQQSPVSDFYTRDNFAPVRSEILSRTPDAPERLTHAYFQRRTPETVLIDEIEHLWTAIADDDDWSLFHAKLDGIRQKREAMSS
ncbi:MAG: selenoprotein O [Ponticaulis sp.]|nr:selenoprotein O [Ponticaulis sp.]|tara:strand:+ start:112562 stop:113953 length:1392 start_codon:yes stop_codon:yes gene_type:complete